MPSARRALRIGVTAILVGGIPAEPDARAQVTPVQRAESQPGDPAPQQKQLDEYISGITAFGFSGAVLVLRDGNIVAQRGCGLADRAASAPNTTATLFDIGSVTKPFTAAAIIKLESAGRLNIADPISKHFPALPADKSHITIHHLLTHTSGLPRGVAMEGKAATDRSAAIQHILSLPLDFAPGQRWGYSNTGYQLLACLIEEVAREPFEDHLRQHLFRPAGMTHTGFIGDPTLAAAPVATGYSSDYRDRAVGRADQQWYHWGLRGCGGILSSLDDLARWEAALRDGDVLSKAEQAKAFTPHHRSFRPGWFYGYGWDVAERFFPDLPARFVGHGGDTRGFECKYYRFPDQQLAVIVLSNTNDHHAWWIPNHLINILFARPFPTPPTVVSLPDPALTPLQGQYTRPGAGALSIRANSGVLHATPVGQTAISALAGSPAPGAAAPEMDLFTEMNRRAGDAIAALSKKDLPALEPLLDPRWQAWPHRLSALLDAEASKRGGLRAHRVLGTIEDQRGLRTWVELQCGTGPAYAALGWNGDLITHFDFPSAQSPSRAFLPESASRFNAYDIPTGKTTALEFRTENGILHALLRLPDGTSLEFTRDAAAAPTD